MYASIAPALSLLSSLYSFIIYAKPVANCSVDVCSFHFIAFMLYSYKFSPSNHLHLILFLHDLISYGAGGGGAYGGCGAEGCAGPVDGVGVVTVAGEVIWMWLEDVVVAGAVIGKWVVSRSWSEMRYAFYFVWCTCKFS